MEGVVLEGVVLEGVVVEGGGVGGCGVGGCGAEGVVRRMVVEGCGGWWRVRCWWVEVEGVIV